MKKISSIILITLLSFMLIACGKQYEDTNGDNNFDLQTITDQNIILLDTGSSGLSYSEQNLADILYSSEYSSKNFSGVEQLYLTNFVLPSDVEITIGHMDVTKGNFKLVVINNDQIIFEIPLDSFGETFRFEDISGTFSVHVAGESAAFEFYIDIQ